MSDLLVRPTQEADIPAIQHIYALEVERGYATFEIEAPKASKMLARFRRIDNCGLPHLVAERDGSVLGYAYAGPYRERPAYRYTVEDSVYVSAAARGQGIGKALLTQLINDCEKTPARQMLALIGDSANYGSIRLHEAAGFRLIGKQRSVGYKLERWVDVVIMQRPLNEGDTANPSQIEEM